MALVSNSFSPVDQHRLALKLRPVLVGELYLARKLLFPVYVFKSGTFQPVIDEGGFPSKEIISSLISSSFHEVYLYPEDIAEIKKNLETALIKITRSLSVGDPLENGTKDLRLLSLNLAGLYQNPHSDELLTVHFQSSQNLGKFLLENKKLQSAFYHNLQREGFHYIQAQPMLSSMMLLSFLQSIHLFHDKEIENLFLASSLKDIGLSMIPSDKYESNKLSDKEMTLFADHADFSFDLLDGRIPLSKNYLTIVKNHHFLNDRLKELVSKKKVSREPDTIYGIESTLVGVFDIITAVTTDRPYRKALPLYYSLELIKRLMSDEYPQEFKALVIFLKQFYKI